MAKPTLPLVLASGSPRRREILDQMGLSYTVDVSDVDESFIGSPEMMVAELSRRKAETVADRHENSLVLAADTIVYDGMILGKPGTPELAREMLKELSGRRHSVFTGMTLVNTATHHSLTRVCETYVYFVNMTDREIDEYVATGEPLDKAGAYAIQGRGGMFVERIEGSYSNVVGLPMAQLRRMLSEIK